MNIVMLMFVAFEAIAGYFSIKIMVSHQVAKFHLRQFHNLEEIGADGVVRPENRYTA